MHILKYKRINKITKSVLNEERHEFRSIYNAERLRNNIESGAENELPNVKRIVTIEKIND